MFIVINLPLVRQLFLDFALVSFIYSDLGLDFRVNYYKKCGNALIAVSAMKKIFYLISPRFLENFTASTFAAS